MANSNRGIRLGAGIFLLGIAACAVGAVFNQPDMPLPLLLTLGYLAPLGIIVAFIGVVTTGIGLARR